MKNVAIFASGSGTNAENIVRYFSKSETIKVAVVLSNNRNVGVHARVNKLGVPSFVFSREEFADGAPVLAKLAEYDTDLIVLAGFMNKISDPLLNAYPGKIINIHPALLPSFPGLHGQGQAVAYGVKFSGCTVHFVDEGTDSGPIILQKVVPVLDDDTEDTLADRILVQEHIALPEALKLWAEGKLQINGRKVKVLA